MITITAFEWVPDFAKGQVRDTRRPAFKRALDAQLGDFKAAA